MNEPSIDARSLLLPDQAFGGSGTAKARKPRPKPKGKPEPKPGSDEWWDRWLTRNHGSLRSNETHDIWRCTSCGAPMIHEKQSGRRGGPYHRMLDRRYGMARCWRVSEGGWRTAESAPHGRGERVLVRHDSRPQSEQPEQDSSVRHLTGGSPSSVANYGKAPKRPVHFTRRISVGATVRVPCVEPKGSVLTISPALTATGQPSSSDAGPPRSSESEPTDD